ncbi:hypothetical protein C5S53_02190, partial [Methanophagales archaeon]
KVDYEPYLTIHPLWPELDGILNWHHFAIVRTEQLAIVKHEAFVHLMF